MLNIVLFGPPGAGKGTQSELLIKKYNLVHLSTGELLRSEIADGTELGKKAKTLMDQGLLVPDEVVVSMIESRIDKSGNVEGFIFDGFPRTEAQAEALDELLASRGLSITCMLALEVDNEELVKRLLNRGKESGRADDKNEEVIRSRIREYEDKTSVLVEYYKKQSKYFPVDGIGSIEQIFSNLSSQIDAMVN